MAKEKNPPPLTTQVSPTKAEAPNFRVNLDLDARLSKFMTDNPEMTEHFTKLVKEHPERAIRTLALRTMFRHEEIARQNERQMPQVEEWVSNQPGLKERLEEKIRTTHPIMRPFIFIREAIKARGKLEFESPAKRTGNGMSV